MNQDQRLLVIGLFIFAGIYVVLCAALGIVEHNHLAVILAIATAGACAVNYLTQLEASVRRLENRWLNNAITVTFIASWALGVAAGVALL